MAKNGEIPAEIGPEELARLLNLSTVRLRNLAREGVIPKPQRGAYQTFGCVQGYIASLKKEDKEDSLTSGRARMTSVKADIAELQRGRLLGELIPVSEARASWSQILVHIRTRMMLIPSKLALRLTQCQVVTEVKAILEGEIREGLEDLSQTDLGPDSTTA